MASFFLNDIFQAAGHNNARVPEVELAFLRLLSLSSVSGTGSLYVVSSIMYRSGELTGKSSMGIKVWQILLTPCLSRLHGSVRRRSALHKGHCLFILNSILFVGPSVTCRLDVNRFTSVFLEFL